MSRRLNANGVGWQLRAIAARRQSARRHATGGLIAAALLGIAAGTAGALELCPLAIILTALAFAALIYATFAAMES
jgi:hypothetical protein